MGDMGDVFKEMTRQKKIRKAKMFDRNVKKIMALRVDFDSNNGGYHLVIYGHQIVDFWPSTGRWSARGGPKGFNYTTLEKFLVEK